MKLKVIILFGLAGILACGQTTQKIGKASVEPTQPKPQIALPWQTDFSDQSLAGWEIVNDKPTREATWQIEQGLLVQGSGIRVKEETYRKYLGTHIVAGDPAWRNYSFGASLRNLSRNGVGVLFRYQDAQNYYRLLMLENSGYGGPFIQLDRCRQGTFQVLAKVDSSGFPAADETVQLAVQARNDTLQAWLQGKRLFEVTDSSFARGKIGFSTFANPRLCVGAVQVTNKPVSTLFDSLGSVDIQVKLNHESGNYPFGIRGIVFLDKNQNGFRDENEAGVPRVAVSDGREVTLTNEYGVYSLENAQKDAQFVFISVPANYEKTAQFYYLLDDSLGQRTFNFPLNPLEAPETLPVKMAQITDIHVEDEVSRDHFQEVLQRVNRLRTAPKFIFATGDLVETGSIRAELEAYSAVTSNFSIPVYPIFGNHDRDNGLNRLRNYHQLLGPDYYSFDYANWHFVAFNNIIQSPKQLEWLEHDLKYAAEKNVILFQHYAPDEAQLAWLKKYPVKAIFSGHWHSNKIFYAGLTSFSTPPFRFGGIDNSPAGFRMFTLAADSVSSQYVFSTLEPKIHLVSPFANQIYEQSQLEILLNIYDGPNAPSRVAYQLTRPGSYNEIGELTLKNEWTWSRKIQEPLTNGEYELNLTIWTGDNAPLKQTVPFTVKLKTEIKPELSASCPMFKRTATRAGVWEQQLIPPLHLKWASSTAGHIDFAAPVVAESLVVIPTKDLSGLLNNSICAFDARNGEFAWCFETRAAISHSLAIYENQVFGQDVQGNIYALDLFSGELVWQQTLGTDPAEFWLYATPVVGHERLFAGNAAGIMAVNPENGAVLWKKKLGSHWISSYSSPSLSGGRLVLGAMWDAQNLYVLDALSGSRLWDFRIHGAHGAPLIAEETVYVTTSGGKLVAIRLDTGEEKWRYNLGDGWSPTTPTAFGSLIIAGSGDGRMIAVNRNDGQPVWEFQCQESIFAFSPYRTRMQALTGSPVVTEDIVYFGATDGFIYALHAANGRLQWKYNLGVPILSTPAIVGNALYTAAYDGNVYCFVADQVE